MNKEKKEIFSEISERISQIIDFLNITPNKFGEKLGYSRSQTIYDTINKKSNPSFDFFYRFSISEYSEIISLEWLISGKGKMRKSDYVEMESENNQVAEIQSEYNVIKLERELQDLRQQNKDLITTNLNLSDILKKKSTAEGA